MSFKYKNVLLIGATSGIGEALASRLVDNGVSVIVTGRRQERLDDFVKSHQESANKNGAKVSSAVFDITKLSEIPQFAAKITKEHPDLDCLFLNSGIQRPFDFNKPESLDLDTLEFEMLTNYTSYMHMLKAFLPFLQKKKEDTSIVFTTSTLALVPISRCPNYCATKAALHHFIMTLRHQLKQGSNNIKVIEILPPAVQTELHDEKHQPDIKNGRQMGMPINEFTDDAWAGLVAGKESIPVGQGKQSFEAIEPHRENIFKRMNG